MAQQQVGKLSSRALQQLYWRGAGTDLVVLEYVECIDRKKGCLQWYRLLRALPVKEDFDAEIQDHYTRTITTWLDVVEEELNELKEEIEEWRGNMQGTNLESTDKYQEVEEAEDALVCTLDTFKPKLATDNPKLRDINVAVSPKQLCISCCHRRKFKRNGRYWRAQEVCNILAEIGTALRAETDIGAQGILVADMLRKVHEELGEVDFPKAF